MATPLISSLEDKRILSARKLDLEEDASWAEILFAYYARTLHLRAVYVEDLFRAFWAAQLLRPVNAALHEVALIAESIGSTHCPDIANKMLQYECPGLGLSAKDFENDNLLQETVDEWTEKHDEWTKTFAERRKAARAELVEVSAA